MNKNFDSSIKFSVDEEHTDVLEKDILLPDYLLKVKGREARGGTRQLMAAILSDGVEAYVRKVGDIKNCSLETELASCEIRDWVEIKDLSYVFSFDNVCDSLGINPDYLRHGIKKYINKFNSSEQKTIVWRKIRRPRKVT